MFLLVPAYPGCPGQMAIKWLLLLNVIQLVVNFLQLALASWVPVLGGYDYKANLNLKLHMNDSGTNMNQSELF